MKSGDCHKASDGIVKYQHSLREASEETTTVLTKPAITAIVLPMLVKERR
jgi:hypothetical protein